jgi:hypothetical protein
MTKHTKGPWRYDFDDGYCGELIAHDGSSVCTFVDEPNAADATLIAEAPALLEVLQEILADGVHSDVVPHLHRKARAVIARATGAEEQ